MVGRDGLSQWIDGAAALFASGVAARVRGWDPPRRTPQGPRPRRRAATIGLVGVALAGSVVVTWAMLRFDLAGALAHALAEPLRSLLGPSAPGLIQGSIWAVWLVVLFGLAWTLRRRVRRRR